MLRLLMPASGPAPVINDAWRESVEAKLKELGWYRADLAREIGCAASVISDLLNGKKNQSPYVPDIHILFGWTPPQGPLPTEDKAQLDALWARLDAMGKAKAIERLHALVEQHGEQPRDPQPPSEKKK